MNIDGNATSDIAKRSEMVNTFCHLHSAFKSELLKKILSTVNMYTRCFVDKLLHSSSSFHGSRNDGQITLALAMLIKNGKVKLIHKLIPDNPRINPRISPLKWRIKGHIPDLKNSLSLHCYLLLGMCP